MEFAFFREQSHFDLLIVLSMLAFTGCGDRSIEPSPISICDIYQDVQSFVGKDVIVKATAIYDERIDAIADGECPTGPSSLGIVLVNMKEQWRFVRSRELSSSQNVIGVSGQFIGTIQISKCSGTHCVPGEVVLKLGSIREPTFKSANDQYDLFQREY